MGQLMALGLALEAGIGIWLMYALWELRGLRTKTAAQLAAAIARRRSAEDPEIPDRIASCLRELAAEAAQLSAGRRMFGQAFADRIRMMVRLPDSVLAVVLYEVIGLGAKASALDAVDDADLFPILMQGLTAAAVDLASLELELTS